MKPVKTLPRFKCDFCKRRSTKAAMERHEKRCFRNPNRFCDNCDNKGYIEEYIEEQGSYRIDCHFCGLKSEAKTKAIDEYYKAQVPVIQEVIDKNDIPF